MSECGFKLPVVSKRALNLLDNIAFWIIRVTNFPRNLNLVQGSSTATGSILVWNDDPSSEIVFFAITSSDSLTDQFQESEGLLRRFDMSRPDKRREKTCCGTARSLDDIESSAIRVGQTVILDSRVHKQLSSLRQLKRASTSRGTQQKT
jgi:hypothetical protein